MIGAGVDVGSITAKAAVYDSESARIVGRSRQLTGWRPREAGNAVLLDAVDDAGLTVDDVVRVVGTGYGRVSLPFVDETVTEISCHARGAHFLHPGVGTVIDIGGQDSKVVAVDPSGLPVDFAMNDRCAAGTGRFFQVMAEALGVELEELGELALSAHAPVTISSVCTVFAESEIVGLIAQGVRRTDIAAGICGSVAKRVANLVARVGARPALVLTGGVAHNVGVLQALSEAVGMPITVASDPQLVGAIGAAIIAAERAQASA
jgi:predicted CoA-substrate-specific enzyme activase